MCKDVGIIGGGLSGLTLAYYLHRAGIHAELLEASSRLGGALSSETKDGFVLEHGPNTVLGKPILLELLTGLGLEDEILTPSEFAKERYLVKPCASSEHGKLEPLPRSLSRAASTPILSTKGKLRASVEAFVRTPTQDDCSVHEFISRRFGAEVAQEIFAPLLAGIWAADITKLSARTALPQLWQSVSSGQSLTRAALSKAFKAQGSEKTDPRPKILSLRSGVEEVIHRLARALPQDRILLKTKADSIREDQESAVLRFTDSAGEIKEERYRVLVLCCPTTAASSLLSGLSPALGNAVASIPHAPLGMIHISYDKNAISHPLDGFGFLVPPERNLALLGCIFNSSLFSKRAPENKHLLTCFVGGALRPEFTDVESKSVQDKVQKELRSLLGIQGEGRILSTRTWGAAIPNYPVGHSNLQRELDALNSIESRIHVLANWHRGLGVPDRIAEAAEIARLIGTRVELSTRTRQQNLGPESIAE